MNRPKPFAGLPPAPPLIVSVEIPGDIAKAATRVGLTEAALRCFVIGAGIVAAKIAVDAAIMAQERHEEVVAVSEALDMPGPTVPDI